jgi:hypothetical protein
MPAQWRDIVVKLFNFLNLVILLAGMAIFAPTEVHAGQDDSGEPFTLTLVTEAGQTGVFRYVAHRYEVGEPKGKADRVEASAVATGFEFSFLGAIKSAGRVEVTLDLTLTLPEKHSGKVPTRVKEHRVAATIETADGEPFQVPATKHGPAIVVTPSIIADTVGPQAISLKVEVPVGGEEISMPTQRLVSSVKLIGTNGSKNSIREAAGHSFVTGINEGTAVLTTLQEGTELAAVISSDGGTAMGLEVAVDCDFVDEPVSMEPVLVDGLPQHVQLPVARSLEVETVVSVGSGQTVALAGLFIGGADPTEIIVILTPELLEGTPVPQALVEARLILLAGSGEDPEPVEGATERTQRRKQLTAEATEPGSARLLQQAKQSFIVGDQDGETVRLLVASDTALRFSPRILAPEEILLAIDLSAVDFTPKPPTFPLNTASGPRMVELPETRILELNTDISVFDGQSVAAGAGLLERILPGDSRKTQTIFIGTTNVLDGGMVRLKGQLVQVTEQSIQPGFVPDEVEYECSGSFNSQSKTDPDGVEHITEESLQCRKVVPSP